MAVEDVHTVPVPFECRPVADVCDVAEFCTGSSADCPIDGFEPDTTECRPVAGLCDAAEFCTGNAPDCPVDGFETDGTSCDDGLYCNGADTCSGGSCSTHTGTPCLETECNTCQEATDSCFDVAGTLCTDDGNGCTDDECDGAGACAHPANTAPCDDGLYCNGTDTCSGGSCSTHTGTPCLETECNTCQEATDSCFDVAGTLCTDDGNGCTNDTCDGAGACIHPANTAPCNDGLYCNGADTCSGGNCSAHTGSPCLETECNTCQEATDSCFDPSGTVCTDDGNECTDDECDGAGVCAHLDNTGLCDDGLYCTQIDECQGGLCIGWDDPCTDNGAYCDGLEYCQEEIGTFACNSTGNPCDAALLCDDLGDLCDVSDVTLIVTDTYGYSGTIPIELANPLDNISEVHLDLCDIDLRPWLTIDTNSCSTTTRSSDFTCTITNLGNGCAGIDITTAISGLIGVGTGPIAQITYTIDPTAPLTDVADVNPENIDIKDDGSISVSVTPQPGRVGAFNLPDGASFIKK